MRNINQIKKRRKNFQNVGITKSFFRRFTVVKVLVNEKYTALKSATKISQATYIIT